MNPSKLQESSEGLSSEEQDQLNQSTKKVKFNGDEEIIDVPSLPELEGQGLETPKLMEESPIAPRNEGTDSEMADPKSGANGNGKLLGINGRGNESLDIDEEYLSDIELEEEEDESIDQDSETIGTMRPLTDNAGDDFFAWDLTHHGKFTIKSAFDSLSENHSNTTRCWKQIWKSKATERVRIFLWSLSHGRLMTEERLVRRELSNEFFNLNTQDWISANPARSWGNDRDRNWNSAPDDGWLKLNVDGSHWHHNNSISCVGAFRDSCGNWVLGFVKNIGYGFTLKAELIGSLTGLKVDWEQNMKNILVEMDSQLAIKYIEEGINGDCHWDPILVEIKKLVSRDWNVKFNQVSREDNALADKLAKLGHHI
ncbi:putative ribonuclease H-like domain-containing protein [Senna tora]|uniref:Putative ribonuclease H-like domain-containing protein n=1 Tax=Senna tora TaxID=362788 RepID=A0A834XBE7_9FABA|nr:putative ribonuclease H-like domain-containing protein [Senna tora]